MLPRTNLFLGLGGAGIRKLAEGFPFSRTAPGLDIIHNSYNRRTIQEAVSAVTQEGDYHHSARKSEKR